MSFYYKKSNSNDRGSPRSRSHKSKKDRSSSNDRHSPKNKRRSGSRDSDRKPYRKEYDRRDRNDRDDRRDRNDRWDNKEKYRDSYRDNRDSSKTGSKFKNEGMAGANLPKMNWDQSGLIPFQKEFYAENPTVKGRSQQEIDEFRSKNQITYKSTFCPRPIFSFEEASFPSYISEQLVKRFTAPTPIQSQGWPAALGGYDVIGIAQTGSGKTLSFLLPGFVHINAQPSLKQGDGPIGLVLAPTRELAMQIQEECLKFGRNAKVSSACVFGGADRYGQQRELNRGNHIVVATPGRLLDFLEAGVINLKRVTYLVLDEADRMLDMGFEPQIRRILSQIRPDRQTLMWSATWPREVQNLALEFCREKPVHIIIGNNELTVNKRIKQNVEVVDNVEKRTRILKILSDIMDGSKILIFTQTKRGADQLASTLGGSNMHAVAIHGDKSQGVKRIFITNANYLLKQRDYIMRQFKTGRSNILVATDLAARGLDVADIRYVINYDFPTHIEDYIHRVGRTGRAGRDGNSFTFFTRDDYKHASKLIDILQETGQEIPEELYRIARRPVRSSNSYRPNQKSYSSYSSYSVTIPNGKSYSQPSVPVNTYGPQESKPSQPAPQNQQQAKPPTQQPAQPAQPGQPNMYSNPNYFFSAPQMSSHVSMFNGYQTLDPTAMNYQLGMMNYYNQMQAWNSLSTTLGQMDGKPADPSQQQAIQNLNAYAPPGAQNTQNPPPNPQYPQPPNSVKVNTELKEQRI